MACRGFDARLGARRGDLEAMAEHLAQWADPLEFPEVTPVLHDEAAWEKVWVNLPIYSRPVSAFSICPNTRTRLLTAITVSDNVNASRKAPIVQEGAPSLSAQVSTNIEHTRSGVGISTANSLTIGDHRCHSRGILPASTGAEIEPQSGHRMLDEKLRI